MDPHPWLAHYPKNISWDTPLESKPVPRILDDTATQFPDRPAIDFFGKITTYNTLSEQVNRAAEGFRKLGVRKSTKVGLFLPNCPQFVIAYYAILKAGGTVVNFSPLYALPELEHQLVDSQTEIMVTLDLEALYPKVRHLLESGKLKKAIISSMQDALPLPASLLFRVFKGKEIASVPHDKQHIRWRDLLRHDPIAQIPDIRPSRDIAVLQYTGGTTGTPKGAVLTHQNVHINALQSSLWCDVDPLGEGRVLAVLPFFHVFAMTTVMNYSLIRGNCMIIHPRFELNRVLKDIHKKKPTAMPGVPTMYNAIIHAPNLKQFDLSSLKACISGGAGLPLDTKQQFESLTGCTLIEGYGLTEASPVVCANPIQGINKAGSIGLPLPGTEVLIEDMENRGTFLGPGERGELCIRGPQVMQGYWQQPEETANVLEDGLLRTGDIAMLDEEGYIFIVDRLKEVILSGGFNIYPRTIEEALYQHEAVIEAAVIGIPDDYRGQSAKAFVALKEGSTVTEKDLMDFLRPRIGKHEMPEAIEFRKELPKTMIGKISKKDLVDGGDTTKKAS